MTCSRTICVLLALLLIAASLVVPEAQAATDEAAGATDAKAGRPVLLLTEKRFRLDTTLQQRLAEAGFEVVVKPLGVPMGEEQLRLFEAVVLPDFAGAHPPHFVPRNAVRDYLNTQANLQRLHAYAEAGGGLLLHPKMAGGGREVAHAVSEFIKPWGARLLAEQIRDDAHTGALSHFAWTTDIADSPATQGVERIWYPTNMLRWDDAYATPRFVLDDAAWQPLVRAMPGSTPAVRTGSGDWLPHAADGPPVIAALRSFGRGRVAITGISGFVAWSHAYDPLKKGWIGESNIGPIDNIFMTRGDGQLPSDGLAFLTQTLTHLADAGRSAGFTGYTPEAFNKVPLAKAEPIPAWLDWSADVENNGRPIKTLVGVRTDASDGSAPLAEYVEAARAAGYEILVVTETFEHLTRAKWDAMLDQLNRLSSDELVIVPGFDIADAGGNRYLLIGSETYPSPTMLTPGGKALAETQWLSLGFGTHATILHKTASAPLPHQLFKFFAGLTVYTYRDGKRIDDSTEAYQWQINNVSNPFPITAHEIYSPEEVTVAANADKAHQLYVRADTPANAAWYMRAGMQHFWETPTLFLVTAGPMITVLNNSTITANSSDARIRDIKLFDRFGLRNHWRPNSEAASPEWAMPTASLHTYYLEVTDSKGRTAFTPGLRVGQTPWYIWRCSDRQNFFGMAFNYTGTRTPGLAIRLGDDQMAPMLELAYASPEAVITDLQFDQRYYKTTTHQAFGDARPMPPTTRSRYYAGRARYTDFGIMPSGKTGAPRPVELSVVDIDLRLRRPMTPDSAVFPIFARPGNQPTLITDNSTPSDKETSVGRTLTEGYVDLPVGGAVNRYVALSDGLRVDSRGNLGFSPASGSQRQGLDAAVPANTQWRGQFVIVPEHLDVSTTRQFMGLAGPTPYQLSFTQGKLDRIAFVAHTQADNYAVAGSVTPAETAPFVLPVFIEGLNPRWSAGRIDASGKLDQFGIFEGVGRTKLDVTKSGPFFAGNLLIAPDAPQLYLTVTHWDDKSMRFIAHNPTGQDIKARVYTPEHHGAYKAIDTEIEVKAFSSANVQSR